MSTLKEFKKAGKKNLWDFKTKVEYPAAFGYVTITYNPYVQTSRLHLDFKREDGLEASISLTHNSVKELLKLIVNNL